MVVEGVLGPPASRRIPWRPGLTPTGSFIAPGTDWGSRRGLSVRPCVRKILLQRASCQVFSGDWGSSGESRLRGDCGTEARSSPASAAPRSPPVRMTLWPTEGMGDGGIGRPQRSASFINSVVAKNPPAVRSTQRHDRSLAPPFPLRARKPGTAGALSTSHETH